MLREYDAMHARTLTDVRNLIGQAAFKAPSAVRSALNGIMTYPLLADRVRKQSRKDTLPEHLFLM